MAKTTSSNVARRVDNVR